MDGFDRHCQTLAFRGCALSGFSGGRLNERLLDCRAETSKNHCGTALFCIGANAKMAQLLLCHIGKTKARG
jgi:hypothetical protein